MTLDAILDAEGFVPTDESRSVWVHPERVAAMHELRGSCPTPACPKHGYCHCIDNCGQRTAVAKWANSCQGVLRGYPNCFVRGHSRHHPDAKQPDTAGWSRRGVPIEKVKPLASWLRDRYGFRGACEVAGVSFGTMDSILYGTGHRTRVADFTARRITETVLAHRQLRLDPWAFEAEEPRRVIPQRERDRLEDVVRREKERRDTAKRRARLRQERASV